MQCEVCGSTTKSAFSLGNHPLCDDLKVSGSSEPCTEYAINIFYCQSCKTAFNQVQVDPTILFPENYHYRPRFTKDVLDGMHNLLTELNKKESLFSKKILDIGCNDGSLLNIARSSFGCKTYGIEPTGAADEAIAQNHTIIKDYFDEKVASYFVDKNGIPDHIIFTNVFAHIGNLPKLLEALKVLINDDTRITIENHYLGSITSKYQFDTFYHEHPRTYSLSSFNHIAKMLGLKIINIVFPGRYGGNIRVTLAKSGVADPNLECLIFEESTVCDNILNMQGYIEKWKNKKKRLIHNAVEKFGKIPAKAFPGRSAILYKMLGLTSLEISGCFEKNESLKNNHYIPGTNILIRPEKELRDYLDNDQVPILNSAWHITDEIHKYIKKTLDLKNPIIDLIDPCDFD